MTAHLPPSTEDLKQALIELTELSPEARAARLQALQASQPALAHALLPLLPDALATLPALDGPRRWAAQLLDTGLPERLGPWRVLHEIGRGGMGVVLRGERADGAFDMPVAIKVLPPALVGAQGAARLAAEARMLGRLDHPNIARLIDAGVDAGCAYLVMAFVDGSSITRHAQTSGLDHRARVRLLLQLCGALQFAHAQLLVHRDIKPENVLVDRDGQVRLLDFGIAKVVAGEQAAATRQAGCTPAYASPEQLVGEAVSVASDVFSLGALAWTLLAGQRPFNPEARGGDDLSTTLATVRAVLEAEPDRRALQRAQVPEDLQAVLLKALDKAPARRYASVEALAADWQAWLDGRPVQAQPPSWAYRSRKFLLRHRWPVAGGALATSAVLGFAGWALVSADQARAQQAVAQARLQAVRAIANRVVFDYNRLLEPVAGTLALRQTLVADALGYLEALAPEAKDDVALQSDLAAGFEAVGDVQGRGVSGGNLGDLPGAQRSFERAAALRQPLCAQGVVLPPHRLAPAASAAIATSTPTAAVAASAGAAAASGAAPPPVRPSAPGPAPGPLLAAGQPGSLRSACAALARTWVRLGDNAFTQRQMDRALPTFDQALQAANQALAQAQDDSLRAEAQDVRFEVHQRLAGLSMRQSGQAYARGLSLARDGLAAAEALVALAPGLKSQENLRVAQDFLAARLLAEGQVDEALGAVRSAVATARALGQARPGRDAGVYLAASLSREAEIQAHRLQHAPARSLADQALRQMQALHQAEPEDRHLRARLANIGRRFGQVNNLVGDSAALADNRRVLPELLAVSQVFTPADGVFYDQHLQLRAELADTLLRSGDAAGALRALAQHPTSVPPQPRAAAELVDVFLLRAQAHRALGQAPQALAALDASLKVLQTQVEQTPSLAPAAARLAWAQAWAARWAQEAPAVAGPMAGLGAAAQATQQRLAQAGQLTPWWQQRLQAVAPR